MAQKIPSQYGHIPETIGQYAPQFKHHTYSQKRQQSGLQIFKSIRNDPSVTLNRIFDNIVFGTSWAVFLRAFMMYFSNGQKQVFVNRLKLNPVQCIRLFRFPVAFGIIGGISWYLLYDNLLCPHGQATLYRHILAYAIAGGMVVGTLYNPGSTFYGMILGSFYGFMRAGNSIPILPSNFHLNLQGFEQAKKKAQRDDDQLQLSKAYKKNKLQSNRLYYI